MTGGPFVDPVDGAALVFQDVTPSEVDAFARDDPCTLHTARSYDAFSVQNAKVL